MHGWETRMLLRHYLQRGVSKAALARRFGVSRRTIHEWVETGQLDRDLSSGGGRYSPRPAVPHKLAPYTGIVEARLEEFPGLSAKRLSHSRGRGEYAGVAGGQVASSVTRFRTGLEGARDYTLAGRLSLRPSVEVGLRHDGGDAESGAGLVVGSGLVLADASTGLAIDLRVRMLVLHQAEGFRERDLAVSLSYTPTPSTPPGLSAREADRGYELPVGRRFVGTLRVGVGTSADGRDYRLGYGLEQHPLQLFHERSTRFRKEQ